MQQNEETRALALTKAALEGLRRLGLSPVETAAALGVPAGALTAMRKGSRSVDGLNGEAEAADAIVRMVKRLTALLGAEETKWRSWLRRDIPSLRGTPLALMIQRQGVSKLVAYLFEVDTL